MKRRLYFMTFAVSVLMIFLSGCAAKDPLVGKWEDDQEGFCYRFEFTEDKAINELYVSGLWLKNIYDYEDVGGVIYLSNGQYFEGGTYVKDLIGEGDPFGYRIDGNKLTFADGAEFQHVNNYTKTYGVSYEK